MSNESHEDPIDRESPDEEGVPSETRKDASAPEAQLLHLGFKWPRIDKGNCTQEDGCIEFWSDGRARWSCKTKTRFSISGDYWHAWIHFVDTRGLPVQYQGAQIKFYFKGPEMSMNHGFYEWRRDFSASSEVFKLLWDVANEGIQRSSC